MGNEMYHYGVLGMRWGVRKQQYRAQRRKIREDAKTYAAQQKATRKELARNGKASSKMSEMSDEELKAYHNRLKTESDVKKLMKDMNDDDYLKTLEQRVRTVELEKRYKDATTPPPKAGKKWLNETLPHLGTVVVGTAATAAATIAVGKILKLEKTEEAAKLVKKF